MDLRSRVSAALMSVEANSQTRIGERVPEVAFKVLETGIHMAHTPQETH